MPVYGDFVDAITPGFVIPLAEDYVVNSGEFVRHDAESSSSRSTVASGPGEFVPHQTSMVGNVKRFIHDVGDGFTDAASSAKDFVKHGVDAGENIMDGLGTGVKSLGNMVEYLPWIAIAGVGVYALSTLNTSKRRRIS